MAYEINLKGTRNERFRRLSVTATLRLFRRDGRMEVRILRSFKRAVSKPIRNVEERKRNQSNRRKNAERLTRIPNRQREEPKI